MNLVFEDVPAGCVDWLDTPDADDTLRVLAEILSLLEASTPEPDRVSVVFAGSFTDSVQRRLTQDDAGAAYSDERLAGYAVGKTMPREDGSIDVILPAFLLFGSEDESDEQRSSRIGSFKYVAAHEAQHVGMRQRGEATHDVRSRLATSEAHGYFIASAGVVLEEHRAELVAAESRAADEQYWASMPDTFASMRCELEDAVTLRHPRESIDRTMRTAFGAVHNMWIAMAYLAAHLRAERALWHVPAALAGSWGWQRYVADYWDEFARLLDQVPPGNERADPIVLDELVRNLADLLTRWLNTIGFDLRDIDEGMYFDVLTHDF